MRHAPDFIDLNIIAINTGTVTAASVATMFLDTSHLFGVLIIIMFVDTVLGIMASITIGEKITSRVMKLGLMTKLALLFLLGGAALILKAFYFEQSEAWLTWLFWFFTAAEFYSAIGNYSTIKTKERAEEGEVVSLVLRKSREVIKAVLGLDREK